MSNPFIRLLARLLLRPWLLLAGLLALTLLALASAGGLQINSTPYMIDPHHPSREADHTTKRLFLNSGEQAFVAIDNPQGNVFNADSLRLVAELTQAFAALHLDTAADVERLQALGDKPLVSAAVRQIVEDGLQRSDVPQLKQLREQLLGAEQLDQATAAWLDSLVVRLEPVRKVRSLATLENMQANDGGLQVGPLMRHLPSDQEGRDALRRETLSNPLYVNGLVSPDGSATTVQIEFNIAEDDSPAMLLAYQAIRAITDQVQGADSIHLSGPPMIAAQTAANMEKDNQTLLPAVLLVILLVLFVSFGRLQGVIVPMLIAVLTLFWTLGLMAACGVKQNIITSMLPVFIISIAVCDAIHFLADYYRHLPPSPDRQARYQAAMDSLRLLFWPMLATSLTTIVGFFSLAWTEVTFIREFGIFVGIGVLFAWLITMFFLPAIVILWKAEPPRFGLLRSDLLERLTARLGGFANYGKPFVMLALVLVVLGGWYVSQGLRVDNQVIGYFEKDSQIRIDDAAINAKFGGTTPISVLIEGTSADAFKQPQVILALDKIQQRLRQQALIGYTYSPGDYIKRLNQLLDESPQTAPYRLPAVLSQELLAQYFLLYENANGRDLFDVVDRRFQSGRIVAVLHSDRSSDVSAVMQDILAYAREVLPAGMSVRVSGYGEILVATTDAVVWGQVYSLLAAAVLIVLMVMLTFRSVRLGLLALLPLVFTLVVIFVLMTWTDTALDIGTSIIAAISFGIGIDYAIHTIAAIRDSHGDDMQALIRQALQRCAKPILINTLALGLGFLVLSLSGYQALVNLGFFIALTMLFSALFALLVLPVFVARGQPLNTESLHTAEPANA